MGTKLTELRDGCFHKALDDEPMFVLLARDTTAPDLVEFWAWKREQEIATGKRPASDMDQINEARDTADKMRLWRDDNDGAWRVGLFSNAPATEARTCDVIGTNTGHGHAWARPDGTRARCGGVALCAACKSDQALVNLCLSPCEATVCTLPPPPYNCTRVEGHSGPCATVRYDEEPET